MVPCDVTRLPDSNNELIPKQEHHTDTLGGKYKRRSSDILSLFIPQANMPSVQASLLSFAQSLSNIGISLLHAGVAVLQAIMALIQELLMSILKVAQALVELVVSLTQSVVGFILGACDAC